jgi:hypothetical protein
MSLVFPADEAPSAVWGIEISPYVDAAPLYPIVVEHRGGDVLYRWETTAPRMEARYRLEWRASPVPVDSNGREPGESAPASAANGRRRNTPGGSPARPPTRTEA